LDVIVILILLLSGNQIAERTSGQSAVLQGTIDHFTAEGAICHSLHAQAHHGGVVRHLAADDALILTQQVGGLSNVVDLHAAAGGIGLVNGLTGTGVNSGSVAEEHVGTLVDHGLGKLNTLVTGGEVTGVDDVQSGNSLTLLLAHIGGSLNIAFVLA